MLLRRLGYYATSHNVTELNYIVNTFTLHLLQGVESKIFIR